MKLHLTFTKFLAVAVFVLGCVLPVTAEPMPQPYKSVDNNIVDWWDEYEYMDSTKVPVKMSKEESSLNASRNQSYNTSVRVQGPDSYENMQNRSNAKKTV